MEAYVECVLLKELEQLVAKHVTDTGIALADLYNSPRKDKHGNVWVTQKTTAMAKPRTQTLITCHTDSAAWLTDTKIWRSLGNRNADELADMDEADLLRPFLQTQEVVAIEEQTKTGKTIITLALASPKTTTPHTPKNPLVIDNSKKYPVFQTTKQVLGADDGCGIAIACSLIEAGKPYDFVFYANEEVGGIGSSASASDPDAEKTYAPYARAIAFDRRGHTDIITHQGGRTASDSFARSFAALINTIDPSLHYTPSPNGIFTDTANLTDLVPECSNVSVGYQNEHSSTETLDYTHFEKLLAVLLHPDCTLNDLPAERDPNDLYEDRWGYDYGSLSDDYRYHYYTGGRKTKHTDTFKRGTKTTGSFREADLWDALADIDAYGLSAAEDLVWDNPAMAAYLLTQVVKGQMTLDSHDYDDEYLSDKDYYRTGAPKDYDPYEGYDYDMY